MCSGYGDLTADGLERGAAAGTAEILRVREERVIRIYIKCSSLTIQYEDRSC